MTDHNHALRDDIAFMKSLAEAGREGPISGGSILVAAGLIFAAASLASTLVLTNSTITSGLVFPAIWFGATAVFLVCLWLIKRTQPAKGGATRAAGVTWVGAGWAIFSLVVSLMIIGARANAWWIMAALGPIVLSIYGGCWMVGATITRERWLYPFAFGSFALAGVLAWFATQPQIMFLVYAVSLVGLLALPGHILMRKARKAA
ncbi:MAG: hypothetical protein E7812_01760 [Phenylobacterium sp.]|nr:MAG: hypothetical protein E7812_01760 [Phenylobacterium sp.]